ncbi:MAG: hypothetical protein J0J00_09225, partial [Microbacterium sp.]|nr:hypothetical protein [Microbacterium sp.]
VLAGRPRDGDRRGDEQRRAAGHQVAEKGFDTALKVLRLKTLEDLYVAVGSGNLTGRQVIEAVFPGEKQEEKERTEVAYLFVSHDLDVVRHIADRTAVIQHGRFVEVGDSEDVATSPREAYTRRLAAASPYPDPVVQAERRARRSADLAREVHDRADSLERQP